MKKIVGILILVVACQTSYSKTLTAQTGLWNSRPTALIRDFTKGHYIKAEQDFLSNTGIYLCTGEGYMLAMHDTHYTQLNVTIPKGTVMTCQTTGIRTGNTVNMDIKMQTAPDGISEGWPYQSSWRASVPETTCNAEVPNAINLGELSYSSATTIEIPIDLPSGTLTLESAHITGSVLMLGGNPAITLTPGDGIAAGDLAWSITRSAPSIVVTTTQAMPGSYSSYATLTLSCQ